MISITVAILLHHFWEKSHRQTFLLCIHAVPAGPEFTGRLSSLRGVNATAKVQLNEEAPVGITQLVEKNNF